MPTLLSLNVGMPKDVAWRGTTVHTGVWKSAVNGPRMARRLNIDGDGQGDLGGHGGEPRAVLVYQIESYQHWQEFFGLSSLEYGAFGENFTIDGLSDHEVCIGDRFRIGEAEFEVTQPRVTCFRVGMRMGQPQLPALLVAHHRPGFYLRVLTEGRVQAGDEIVRSFREPHALSVAEADALLYLPGYDAQRLRDAVTIAALSPGWRRSFETMLESGPGPGTEPPTRLAPAAWSGFRTLIVSEVVTESRTVASISLASGDGSPLPPAQAGQYLTLRVDGAGTPAPVRSYSLSGAPGQSRYRISVKREPHGLVSSYLHAHLRPGTPVEAAAARGDFVLDDGDHPVLLISAGIGETPVLAMLHRLADLRSDREVWWIHTTHDASTHAFAREAAGLVGSLPRGRSLVFYTTPSEPLSANSAVQTGRLTGEVIGGLHPPVDASAFICGPPGFMDDLSAALVEIGLSRSRIYTERFGSRSPINPGVVRATLPPPHQPPAPIGTGPLVTFARSGISTPWSKGYLSLLELAEACDVPTQYSCRSGVCHTCATPMLAGAAEYMTQPLEPPGPDELLICIARPIDELVLDL